MTAPPRTTPSQIGRYKVLAPIASGGMASVYLGRALGEGGFSRLVAAKLLHPHLAQDQHFVAMFLDEARFAARIRHANVVDVYDIDRIDGDLVIVMQYVEGASLHRMIRGSRDKRVPMRVGLRVIHDVLLGLHAAHELTNDHGDPLHLVHRDVSPHNILVGVDGVARITDFGVAKARGRLGSTSSGAVKGKLRYLSPEQVNGRELDRRTDVFGAGVVLWEVLTGRRLFGAKSEGEVLQMVLQKEIPLPSQIVPEIPVALDRVCLRALERDPARRFATAAEFADALEEAGDKRFAKRGEVGAAVEASSRDELDRLRAAVRGATPDTGEASIAEPQRPRTPSVLIEATIPDRPARPNRKRWPLVVALGTTLAAAIVFVATRSPSSIEESGESRALSLPEQPPPPAPATPPSAADPTPPPSATVTATATPAADEPAPAAKKTRTVRATAPRPARSGAPRASSEPRYIPGNL